MVPRLCNSQRELNLYLHIGTVFCNSHLTWSTPHLHYQCELSEGIKDEKNNICFDSMVDFVIADSQQLGVETNESYRETLVLLKQGDIRTSSTCIIEISDDEVMEICDSEEDGM
ncbi:uncharacterized protein LOC113281661 isoform X2 [Papaver somniferum]|uniref:uncharacterized protein LOC113281661 isoform X2 n=1 Tax=Papaver somniferum TaxID=3469 RepID=UPI000E7026E6|nr:uncharacterized protein LOC113281661 isoform X2 [Papaver somniferum]